MRAFPFHAARRQLYVPGELLERHGVQPHDIFAGRSSEGLQGRSPNFATWRAANSPRGRAVARRAGRGDPPISSSCPGAAVARASRAQRSFRARRSFAVAAAMADLAGGAQSGADRGVILSTCSTRKRAKDEAKASAPASSAARPPTTHFRTGRRADGSNRIA